MKFSHGSARRPSSRAMKASPARKTGLWRSAVAGALMMSVSGGAMAQSMEEDFLNPPERAKPRTWVHALNGNMTKEGFTKDLEAMAEAGLGGIILFHVSLGMPTGPIRFDSPEHHEIVTHVAAECERLGLSFGIHNTDGWTSSGGPWITPENSMKMTTWSETIVQGGGDVNVALPQPTKREGYYQDVAVIAYPTLQSELVDASLKPTITSSHPDLDIALLQDQRWDEQSALPVGEDGKSWIQFAYDEPQTINGVFLAMFRPIGGSREYEVHTSDDGINFTKIDRQRLKRKGKRDFAIDQRLDAVTAKYFRIVLEQRANISEVALTYRPQYDQYLEMISLYKRNTHQFKDLEAADPSLIIDKDQVIDLTGKMGIDGRLRASLPAGDWTVMRFGYTSTSAMNGPASPEGRGLENDKMNRPSFKIHYDAYMGKVIENTREVAPNALQYMEIDSFEVGGQNWTHGYHQLFEEKFGHSIKQYLPLYAGRLVGSVDESSRILWEMRRLSSQLITDNYFAYFTELTNEDDLITYVEPYTFNAPFDEIDAGQHADVPMGEFWVTWPHERYDTGVAVSSARLYGKPIISAEAFTASAVDGNWRLHPGTLKTAGDKAWALGINEFFFHRYAHQPNTHVRPGMTMWQFGSHIDRNQTWWDTAGKEWFEYIARGSQILRQGVIKSDMLVYNGEGSPSTAAKRTSLGRRIPNSINFDTTNTDALHNRVAPKNGKLVLPDGGSYRSLALWNTELVSIATLERIAELADAGIIIIGKRPEGLPGYGRTDAEKARFEQLVDHIWAKPKTYESLEYEDIFAKNDLPLDLSVEGKNNFIYQHKVDGERDIYYIANYENEDGVIEYDFSITGKIPEMWDPVTGATTKLAHFEQTETGVRVPISVHKDQSFFVIFKEPIVSAPITEASHGSAELPMFTWDDDGAMFMETMANGEFNGSRADGSRFAISIDDLPEDQAVSGNWSISFDESFGYGETLEVDELFDWSTAEEFDLKHYSGTATYQTTFSVEPVSLQTGYTTMLNLGEVNVTATVYLNGEKVGTAWSAPYELDISDQLRPGENALRIEVANTWTNRLIGDEHYPRTDGYEARGNLQMPAWFSENRPMPEGQRQTFSAYDFYEATDDLMPSGLVGPVVLSTSKKVRLAGK